MAISCTTEAGRMDNYKHLYSILVDSARQCRAVIAEWLGVSSIRLIDITLSMSVYESD